MIDRDDVLDALAGVLAVVVLVVAVPPLFAWASVQIGWKYVKVRLLRRQP